MKWDNYKKTASEESTKKNAFVRAMKFIFATDIPARVLSFLAAAVIWLISVGLGISNETEANGFADFFTKFANNIIYEFSTTEKIVVSIVDIIALYLLTYLIVYLLRKSVATPLLKYLLAFVFMIIIFSSRLIAFPVMGTVFGSGVMLVLIVILILFPQELRRMVWKLSSKSGNESRFNVDYDCTEEELREAVSEIVKALLNMSKDNIGALIIITTQTVPKHILESGTALGANLSQPLIECLFNTNADLHDGAVVIHGNKILAAGCFLPLSQKQNIPKELGTRHRAAIGISEQYDLLTIVVSEETGIISVARDGKLERYYDAVMLTDVIEQMYGLKANSIEVKNKKR